MDKIKAFFKKVWEWMKPLLITVKDFIVKVSKAVWAFVCKYAQIAGAFIWKYLKIAGTFVWKYLKIAGTFAWKYLKIAGTFAWKYLKIAGTFAWKYLKIAGTFAWKYLKIAGEWIGKALAQISTPKGVGVIVSALLIALIIIIPIAKHTEKVRVQKAEAILAAALEAEQQKQAEVQTTVETVAEPVVETVVETVVEPVVEVVETVVEPVVEVIEEVVETVVEPVVEVIEEVVEPVVEPVVEVVEEVVETVVAPVVETPVVEPVVVAPVVDKHPIVETPVVEIVKVEEEKAPVVAEPAFVSESRIELTGSLNSVSVQYLRNLSNASFLFGFNAGYVFGENEVDFLAKFAFPIIDAEKYNLSLEFGLGGAYLISLEKLAAAMDYGCAFRYAITDGIELAFRPSVKLLTDFSSITVDWHTLVSFGVSFNF